MGGRSYPVRHYPVAIRLRDRKGRAILCLRLSSKWGLVGRYTRSAFRRTPSHKNAFVLLTNKKAKNIYHLRCTIYHFRPLSFKNNYELSTAIHEHKSFC